MIQHPVGSLLSKEASKLVLGSEKLVNWFLTVEWNLKPEEASQLVLGCDKADTGL
jgi:hypothetical protein